MTKFAETDREHGPGVVQWAPPDRDWNPWINQPLTIEGAEEYQVGVLWVGTVV